MIHEDLTIKEALKQMDIAGEKILFVVDAKGTLLGSITDGDIRRWILKEGALLEKVTGVYNRKPRFLRKNSDASQAREVMIHEKLEALPVVDERGVLVNVLLWNEIFSGETKPKAATLRVPVLVMAGGKGTRLDPFTKILPKPLIPIGDKPIVEIIMDQLFEFGCNDFYLTVNYKGKMIQAYFDNAECPYNVKIVWEETFLGTAGSLKLVVPLIDAPHLFVSNCDILIRADYTDVHNFHVQNSNDITVIGSMRHVSVPFGVLEMKNGGHLDSIREKPEYDFLANTGMYLVRTTVANDIPANAKFDFTELIGKVKSRGGKVGVYPVSQDSWVDIGQWQEYQVAIKKLENKA